MIIKPHPGISLEDIKVLLEPVFSLDQVSDGMYDLNINGTVVKHCTDCGKPHNNLKSLLCVVCDIKLKAELRGFY